MPRIRAKRTARARKTGSARGRRVLRPRPKETRPARFVGRAGSPVLDKYPPKAMDDPVAPPDVGSATSGPARPSSLPPAPPVPATPLPTTAAPPGAVPGGPPKVLISLERPFDVDDFSQLLGQTQIQVTVPRDSLAEVLRRACDFMGFGIYVYTIRVRPGPEELLKSFIVELQRVDYSSSSRDWAPFQERGRADSPFGPTGTR